jgi:glycosyltransferase involved in cell wall biosynthesis
MRITHITDYYLPRLGGIEMQVHDLATRQRAAGHDAVVLTQTPGRSGTGAADADSSWVTRVDSAVSQRTVRPLFTGAAAVQLLSQVQTDVVHVHASLISPFAMLAARAVARAGVPTVVTVHSLWSRTGPAPDLAWGFVGHAGWPVIWSAVSKTAAVPVSRTLGLDTAVAVLPNGIDPDAWQIDPAPRSPDSVTIASVMRLSRRKRPMPLLHILRKLRERVPSSVDLRAVVVGDGPLRERMLSYLRMHEMDDWVRLPGRLERPDIRRVFSFSDLYVAPAELESFGIAALEARSAGLPVVASRHGGVGEFISDGDEGFLTGSDREMVQALTTLVLDRRTREAISTHNRLVAPSVNWPIVLERAEVLYAAAQRRAAAYAAVRRGTRIRALRLPARG